MSESVTRKQGAVSAKGSLYLVFYIGAERYALLATEVVEVLPRLALKPIAQAPDWVAGIFAHRDQMVPVIDVSAMSFGRPAVARTSTRLVLVNYRPAPGQPPRLLGLILEQASNTLRCLPTEFKPYGLDNRNARYLGPVREDEQGLLQWICVDELLPPSVCALLFPQALDDLSIAVQP